MQHPAALSRLTFLIALSAALGACGGGGGGGTTTGSTGDSLGASSSAASNSSRTSSSSSAASSSVANSSSSTAAASSTASSAATSSAASSTAASSKASSSAISSSSSSVSSSSSSAPGSASGTGGFSTATGNISSARKFSAASYTEIAGLIEKARTSDAGAKVSTGAYPLHIVYTGNEDSLINQIVKDHTVDANGNCPNPRWNDSYRFFEIKGFTAGITIEGANGSSANFGIVINGGSSNVVIRNMKIGALGGANNDADMIRIDSGSNVWIDHNELFAVNNECKGSPEGDLTFESAIDIKKDSHNITVSYNYIHDSKKVGLDGSSASDIANGREITFHHNYYYNVNGRLPLQRGGWTHMYNNIYEKITESGINVRTGGLALIENNWFQNASNPVTCRYDVVNCGKWQLRNNNTTSSADNATYGITWTDSNGGANADTWTSTATQTDIATLASKITYAYTASSAQCVKDNLAKVVGVGKGYATLSCN